MRILLIGLLALLLGGCSLFEKTPPRVVEGQRAVYQGILLAEENDEKIIKRYIEDTKAAITYHVNFVLESKIDAIRKNPDLNREERSKQIAVIERQRQTQLDEAFGNIEKIAGEMRAQVMKNHRVTKKLVESIYNYLSTSPIEVDNIQFWIEKLKQVSKQPN
jgi:hypothetical protein